MRKKILVTGANGHLGVNTIRALLKNGHEVTAFVRKTSNMSGLNGLSLKYKYGDVRDIDSLKEAANGCEVIIHHAAVYKLWAKTLSEIMEPAIEGTRNLFLAASNSGIEKIIYTSSTTAVGTATDPKTPLTDKDWNKSDLVPYYVAKTKAEELAWELSRKYNIPMLVFCPSGVLGRYDYGVTPTSRLIIEMLRGRGMTVEGAFSFIDARDAAEIYALAVEKGKTGERYILSTDGMLMKDVGKMVTALTGKWVPHFPFPRSINIVTGMLFEMGAKLTGWDPLFTEGVARELSHRYAIYDNSKTLEHFNYKLYSMEETIQDTIRWFSFIGKIRGNKSLDNKFQPEPEWLESSR